MGLIDSQLVSMKEDIRNANSVKNIVIDKLTKDGAITEEQRLFYGGDYNIIIVDKSWFVRFLEKFNKKDESGYIYRYVNFND